jgi:hypothetical protein
MLDQMNTSKLFLFAVLPCTFAGDLKGVDQSAFIESCSDLPVLQAPQTVEFFSYYRGAHTHDPAKMF